jgi:hypothetical protein
VPLRRGLALGLITERVKHLSQVLAWIVRYSRPRHPKGALCTKGVEDR